jgi:diadenylate cyclase
MRVNWLVDWFVESPFSTATWTDWVDISLLSLVLYRVFLVMKGTRAMQSLAGLALLGGLYLLSEVAGLSTVHWVLDNLVVYLVIAVLILFQEDIRRALARAGGTFSRVAQSPSDVAVMEEIIRGVFALAQRKIGALVVIERTAHLGSYLEGAEELDALCRSELLQSVFHPSSPLHDGAVVVREDRIVAAAVFLPISLSRDIARTLGTRHRAAVGITETTDAICLVVSEERATVALVSNGQIVPIVDANDLRQHLMEHLGSAADPAPDESQTEVARG